MGGQTRGIYSILDDGGDSHVGAGVDFKHYAICGKLLGINAFDSNMGVYSV